MIRARAAALGFGVCCALCACKRTAPAPAPTPSAEAAGAGASEAARESHYEGELARSRARWQEQLDLPDCAGIMHENADVDLCPAALNALAALARLTPTAAPDATLPVLADASLALVRLVERARYISLEELGHARLEGDAGALPTPSASARAPMPAPRGSASTQQAQRALHSASREHTAIKLSPSPSTRLLQSATRLERDVLRNLAAYLEYGPLNVRQSALDVVKGLQTAHPHWPGLAHLLREASVLETDAALKQKLTVQADLAQPPKSLTQPTGSK